MSIARNAALAACAVALATVAAPARAAESYDVCTGFIDTLPVTITAQGVWCLRKDLGTALNYNGAVAIDIQANNVTLDCNGFKVGGLGAGVDTWTVGVGSTTSRLNTTIRNCNIRGFNRGISLMSNGGGHLVENNRLELNRYIGILVHGDGSTVRNNRVLTSGGSGIALSAIGIYTGFDVDVVDNLVSGVASKAGSGYDATGILVAWNDQGSVVGNRVREVVGDGMGVGAGIRVESSYDVSVRDNELIAAAAPTELAITCTSAQPGARGNTISGFTTSIVGCTDDGDNISK